MGFPWRLTKSSGVLRSSTQHSCIRPFALQQRFKSSSTRTESDDISSILSKPTWSVKSLLPDPSQATATPEITPKQLHHLLRLSALPQPANKAEEQSMLKTLSSQIHFVQDVQTIDTTGVTPLRAIRDETVEGLKEIEIGLDDLKDVLAREERIGKAGRIKKTKEDPAESRDAENWNPLGSAEETQGRFFVVRTGKK